mmetsp:Transcript_20274/g.25001  ORF Transcript_20274/g.25001 Transcript_20274/m.25001 type:complete len:179 (+) Transcript_20274:1-537(+)
MTSISNKRYILMDKTGQQFAVISNLGHARRLPVSNGEVNCDHIINAFIKDNWKTVMTDWGEEVDHAWKDIKAKCGKDIETINSNGRDQEQPVSRSNLKTHIVDAIGEKIKAGDKELRNEVVKYIENPPLRLSCTKLENLYEYVGCTDLDTLTKSCKDKTKSAGIKGDPFEGLNPHELP